MTDLKAMTAEELIDYFETQGHLPYRSSKSSTWKEYDATRAELLRRLQPHNQNLEGFIEGMSRQEPEIQSLWERAYKAEAELAGLKASPSNSSPGQTPPSVTDHKFIANECHDHGCHFLFLQRGDKCGNCEAGQTNVPQMGVGEQWVDTKKQMPKVGEWCWVVCNGIVQRMAAYLSGKGFACEDGYEWTWALDEADPAPMEAVTHWQPLPQPPASPAQPANQEEEG